MKKKKLFIGLLAVMAIAACTSNDDAVTGNDNAEISDGTPHYMAVNIVNLDNGGNGSQKTTSNAMSRASRANGDFADGTADENKVTSVRFYFFNTDGTPAYVKKQSNGNYTNYYDWTPTSPDTEINGEAKKDDTNIEKVLQAKIVINTKEGDKLPTKMLALVNYTPSGDNATKSLNLSDVRDITDNFKTLADNGKFVMVNSVYAENNERVSTTTIKSMYHTESDATTNPEKVHVERNVAKVGVAYKEGLVGDNGLITVYDASNTANESTTPQQLKINIYSSESKSEETAVYLKVKTDATSTNSYSGGWNLTATTNKEYLSKHINHLWSFGSWQTWNDPTNYRCYWAYNVQSKGDGNIGTDDSDTEAGRDYVDYNSFNTPLGSKTVYTNENAAKNVTEGQDRTYPTQVVVAGTLCNDKGEAITVGDYTGNYYTEAALKNELYKQLNLYVDTTEEVTVDEVTTKQYRKVSIQGLKFISAAAAVKERRAANSSSTEAELNSQNSAARCMVELGLTDDMKKEKTFLLANTYKEGETPTVATTQQVLEALQEAGQALLYKGGRTYYSFKVPHLADKDRGEFGVVRNHWYNCTVNNVYGLGTPVFDPDEKIYPETPVDIDTYIAAQINILSWKKIEKEIDLGK